jgi:hypothetical protein
MPKGPLVLHLKLEPKVSISLSIALISDIALSERSLETSPITIDADEATINFFVSSDKPATL